MKGCILFSYQTYIGMKTFTFVKRPVPNLHRCVQGQYMINLDYVCVSGETWTLTRCHPFHPHRCLLQKGIDYYSGSSSQLVSDFGLIDFFLVLSFPRIMGSFYCQTSAFLPRNSPPSHDAKIQAPKQCANNNQPSLQPEYHHTTPL